MKFEKEDLQAEEPPGGRYRVKIQTSAEGTSRAGNPVVWLCLVVLDGAHREKRVFDNFVVGGKNALAARIGRQRLAKVYRSVGQKVKAEVEIDVRELIGKILEIEVQVEGQGQERRARVQRYEKTTNNSPF